MIRRYTDNPFKQVVYPFPSEDKAGIQNVIATKADTDGALNQWARSVLMPGCNIPLHPHDNTQEVFVMVSGFASYNDNGEETIVGPGDVMYVRAGQSHGIGNPFKEPAVVFELNLPDKPTGEDRNKTAMGMGCKI